VNPSAIVLADGGSASEPASGESFLRSSTNGRGPVNGTAGEGARDNISDQTRAFKSIAFLPTRQRDTVKWARQPWDRVSLG
jgi:hypothetical protein